MKIMKKNYLAALIFIIGSYTLTAQSIDVTFAVDMNTQPISPNGVHLAGSFQNWNASTHQMSDLDTNGVYELTLTLEQDSIYEYKFINGNEWGTDESLWGDCGTAVDGNRTLTTGSDSVLILDALCFASCDPCPAVAQTLTFKVDMSLSTVSPLGVHVAGNFQGWDPSATQLFDEDGDNIYEVVLTGDFSGQYEYKFINGNDWGDDEQLSGDCINSNQNRVFSITSATSVVGPFCYEECGPCIMPVNVNFMVNMANETVSSNGIHLAGSFQGWDPSSTEMLDEDGDGIYEVALEINIGTYQYKFVNGNDWSGTDNDNESVPTECNVQGNREIVLSSDSSVQFCYNQCESICLDYPNAAEITFAVDMTNAVSIEPSGVWLMGSFTSPQWQDGRIQMFEHPDYVGLYTSTVMVDGPADIQYKFSNGEPFLGTAFQDGENYDFETDGCGSSNGIGGFNRTFIRSGDKEFAGTFCYNTCSNCNNIDLGKREFESVNSLYVFPNPAKTTLRFNEATSYQVYNILSEEILKGEGSSIDISSLEIGVYFLQIEGSNETIRFIKN